MDKELALEIIRKRQEILNLQVTGIHRAIEDAEKQLRDLRDELAEISKKIRALLDVEDLIIKED